MRLRRMTARFVFALVLGLGASASAQAPEAANARPGIYVGVGLVGSQLDLDLENFTRIEELGIRLEERGGGGRLMLGYAFAPSFAIEWNFVATDHDTGLEGVTATFGQFWFDAIATIPPSAGRFQPYLAGGMGGAVLALRRDDARDSEIYGGQIDMGGGLEFHASRHLAITIDYRFCVQNFREASLEGDSGDETFEVDGSGTSQTWGMRLDWSF